MKFQNKGRNYVAGESGLSRAVREGLSSLIEVPGILPTLRRIELSKDRGIAVVRSPLSGRRSPEFFIPGTKMFPAHDPVGSIRYILAGM